MAGWLTDSCMFRGQFCTDYWLCIHRLCYILLKIKGLFLFYILSHDHYKVLFLPWKFSVCPSAKHVFCQKG